MQHSLVDIYETLRAYLSAERQELFEKILNGRTRYLCAVIEDIYQDHNSGALMRSCDGLGIQDIHVIQNYNTLNISKSISQGAQKWLSVKYYKESMRCVDALRAQGYRIVASSPHAKAATLVDLDLSQPSAIFFGGEKEGLSDLVLQDQIA